MSNAPRFYTAPGDKEEKKLVSVTSITSCAMKYGLLGFYGKHGNKEAGRIAKEASTIGNDLHTYMNYKVTRPADTLMPIESDQSKVELMFSNADKFIKQFKPKAIATELTVYNVPDGYAGTLDFVGTVKDGIKEVLILADWKSSGSVYSDYYLQVEAYYRALLYSLKRGLIEFPTVIGNIELWVVRLPKDDHFNPKTDVTKLEPNVMRFKAFLGLRDYFYWTKEAKKNR